MSRIGPATDSAFIGLANERFSNQLGYNKKNPKIPSTKEEVIDLLLDAFHSCAERDIYTGDKL